MYDDISDARNNATCLYKIDEILAKPWLTLYNILQSYVFQFGIFQGRYSSDLDQDFHRCLYENVDYSVLLKVLDIFWAIYREAHDRVLMPEPADPTDTYQQHVEILYALAAGDVTAMQAAVKAHRLGIQARVRMLEEAQRQGALSG